MSPVKAAPATSTPVPASVLVPVIDGPLMPGVAWLSDGSAMVATDPKTLKRLKRSELSASTSFQLDPSNCSVSMVASRLLPREDDLFEANQLGTAAHAVLEALFALDGPLRTKEEADRIMFRLREDREFALTLLDKNLTDQIHALDADATELWYAEVQRRVHGLWQIEDPTQVIVHSTEMSFGERFERTVKIGKVPFVGFIDRVDQVLDLVTGEIVGYEVRDYKAGKYKSGDARFGDDYADQIRIYVVAVREHEGIDPTGGALYFITYGKARGIDISPEAINGTIRRFERAFDRMNQMAEANRYPTKVGPLCSWCELVNACPAAIRAKKQDLSDTDKVDGVRVAIPGKKKKGLDPVLLGIPTIQKPLALTGRELLGAEAAEVFDGAAHRENDVTERNPMTASMSTPAPTALAPARVKHGPRVEETIDGVLNGNSRAAEAVIELSSIAVEQLHRNGQDITPATVTALATTYASAVASIEKTLTQEFSWNSGANAIIRTALVTAIKTKPAPWGQGIAAWTDWADKLRKRANAVAVTALKLRDLDVDALPEQPFAVFASDVTASAAA